LCALLRRGSALPAGDQGRAGTTSEGALPGIGRPPAARLEYLRGDREGKAFGWGQGRSGNELLDGGADGFVCGGGPLVQAEQRRLMLGGGEGDQGVVGGSAEDLPGGSGGEKLLVTGF